MAFTRLKAWTALCLSTFAFHLKALPAGSIALSLPSQRAMPAEEYPFFLFFRGGGVSLLFPHPPKSLVKASAGAFKQPSSMPCRCHVQVARGPAIDLTESRAPGAVGPTEKTIARVAQKGWSRSGLEFKNLPASGLKQFLVSLLLLIASRRCQLGQ